MHSVVAASIQCVTRAAGRACVREFWSRDDGQDVVEYGLLAAFIGIMGWVVLSNMDDTIGAAYGAWLDPNAGVPSLWAPAEPTGAGS